MKKLDYLTNKRRYIFPVPTLSKLNPINLNPNKAHNHDEIIIRMFSGDIVCKPLELVFK